MTVRGNPPRRVVLAADTQTRFRRLARSRGWKGEAAALDAVRLLDAEIASTEVDDLAGFFALGNGTYVVVRGAGARPPESLYWREAVALDRRDFSRVRCNPFRILPAAGRDVPRADDEIEPPDLPRGVSAADDLRRLTKLHRASRAYAEPDEFEALLAAVLDVEHTLVIGGNWSYVDLELLLLLFPSPLRPDVTFHTCALAAPAEPVPRLVLTPVIDEATFDPVGSLWGHRLPHTRGDISRRATRAATQLTALLEAPRTLGEAHAEYERYTASARPVRRALLDEVETLLRFAGLRQARATANSYAGLRIVADSLDVHGGAEHTEPRWLFALLRHAAPAENVGRAVATALRNGYTDGPVAAFALERVAASRQSAPVDFEEFIRPVEEAAQELAPEGEDAGSIRTILALLAAARADVAAFLRALPVPLDHELVGRLGGVDAWAPATHPAIAHALQAAGAATTPEGVTAAIEAVGRLAADLQPGADRIRVVDIAVQYARWTFRTTPVEQWEGALPVAAAAMQLGDAVVTAGRMSLTGRPDTEHVRDMLSRSMNPAAAMDLASHTDAEIFLGWLGSDASRSRVTRREIEQRGETLVRAVHERVLASDAPIEAAHWSLALIERVRHGGTDGQYVVLGTSLLRLAAAERASRILRDYVASRTTIALALVLHADIRALFDGNDVNTVGAAALAAAIDEAKAKRGVQGIVAACDRLRGTGIMLGPADITSAHVVERLSALLDELREHGSGPLATHTSPLTRALATVLTPEALELIRGVLVVTPQAGQPAATVQEPAAPTAPSPAQADAKQRAAAAIMHFFRTRPWAAPTAAFFSAAIFVMLFAVVASGTFGDAAAPAPAGQETISDPTVAVAGLAEASALVQENRLNDAIEMLGGRLVARSLPEAVVWDSLLAYAALRQGRRLQSDDVRRVPALRVAREAANRTIALVPPTSGSYGFFRLVRAEACIIGRLGCEDDAVLVDLALAVESPDGQVSRRAQELMDYVLGS
jgi:hypothetical protein